VLYLCANPAWTQGDCAGAPAVRSAQIGPEDSLPTTPVDAGDKRISPTAITVAGGTLVEASMGTQSGTPTSSPLGSSPCKKTTASLCCAETLRRGAIVKPAAASPELLVHRDQQ